MTRHGREPELVACPTCGQREVSYAVISLPDEYGERDLWVMRWPCHDDGARLVAGPYIALGEAQRALMRRVERDARAHEAQLEWRDDPPQ